MGILILCHQPDNKSQFNHYQKELKNARLSKMQPQGVKKDAGHGYSAESWGPGRAVARVPRIKGGGTHASGSGAFANSCRGGHMYAPKRVWRRWTRKTNLNKRR